MDTKERAKLAASIRWGNRKNTNTEVVCITKQLASALKAGAKEQKKVIGDFLQDILKDAHKLANMADKLGPEDAFVASCLREVKASAERVNKALAPLFRDEPQG